MASYNGHRNHAAWNVSLWINNDEGLYLEARKYARRHGIGEGARLFFEQVLKGEKTPDGVEYTKTNVRLAFNGILD